MSNKIQDEFINLCGQQVLDFILKERKNSIYFSVICDATPDAAHIEQNVLILRYVKKEEESRKWTVEERFIEFFDLTQKTGLEIAEEILKRLQYHHNIDMSDCRGQSFDNASNMSGKTKGVQARLLENQTTAVYSPCAAHSLNLVGVHAASCCNDAITYFGSINRLYTLFSSSPDRWEILKQKTGFSLHSQSETRWSSRKEAVRPVARHLPSIIEALDDLIEKRSKKLTHEAFSEAVGLRDYFLSFKSILMSAVWIKVLESFDQKNLVLQSRSVTLDIAVANILELQQEIENLRDNWPTILSEAKLVAGNFGITPELKQGRNKRKYNEDIPLEPEENFKINVFYVILDSLIFQLANRYEHMSTIANLFSPILSFKTLDKEELLKRSVQLREKYPNDLTASFNDEIVHLKNVHKVTFESTAESQEGPIDLLNKIFKLRLEGIFPQVCIAIRIFCTIPLTVAEGERAFSKLSLIKNYLRATMTQDRLNSCALLSIEQEISRKIDFDSVIKDFATAKLRRLL